MKSKNQICREILQQSGRRSGKELLASIPWEEMDSQVGIALKELLSGRDSLRRAYQSYVARLVQKKRVQAMTFALDGRLVGDIGELIAAKVFRLELLGPGTRNVDAITEDRPEMKVQIKATFQTDGLEIKHGGDYFIGLQFNDEGKFRILYNGPADAAMNYLKAPKAEGHMGRKAAGTKLESISLGTWAVLDWNVQEADRIPRRV